MRRHARDLTSRARERIRAAREHDPHAWHGPTHGDGPIDFVQTPYDDEPDEDGHTEPPLGSPEPGAPDLDGASGPAGVSGPPDRRSPEGARARRPDPRPAARRAGAEDDVPFGLRTAAAWSWRL